MIQQIRTFFGRQRGESGKRRTEVKMGVDWICLLCGKVFTNKSLADIHKCKDENKLKMLVNTN
jgi:hypothetical protein